MTNHLQDKVIIITGAATGFGRLVAEGAAERGASVFGADIDEETLQRVFDELADHGRSVACIPADVTDLAQMRALAEDAVERFGRIDVLVNNAGVMPLAFYSDHAKAAASWARAIDVNLKGVLNGIAAVHDQMIAQGRGQIVNVSSTYGNYATEGSGVYGATKSAVNVLSESLRMESQGKIKVSTVRPTGVLGTGLAASVINPKATIGMVGQHAESTAAHMKQYFAGDLPEPFLDPESVRYWSLDPGYVAESILYVIDQPWGISISDITVRAAGEEYLL
jgi:NADP-dependent 3-hydroxy acid dehydrogenase YdfG